MGSKKKTITIYAEKQPPARIELAIPNLQDWCFTIKPRRLKNYYHICSEKPRLGFEPRTFS